MPPCPCLSFAGQGGLQERTARRSGTAAVDFFGDARLLPAKSFH